jgi:hypothetical protein
MRVPWWQAALPLLTVTAGSCTAVDNACTEAGCESTLSIDATPLADRLGSDWSSVTAELCVDGACRTHSLGDTSDEFDELAPLYLQAPHPFDAATEVEEVTLRLISSESGQVLYEGSTQAPTQPREFRPNGPGCPPVCHSLDLLATAENELVVDDRPGP